MTVSSQGATRTDPAGRALFAAGFSALLYAAPLVLPPLFLLSAIAPFPLMTYADSKDMAPLMADMTATKKMPPWGAHDTAECKPRFPWKDDLRLSAAQIAVMKAWSDQGAPEGDPKDAPPAKPPAPPVTLTPGVASPDPAAPTPTVKLTAPSKDQVIPADKAGDFAVKLDVKSWQTAPR